MPKTIAGLLATSLICTSIYSYAGPLKKVLIGAVAVTAATYALGAKNKSAVDHVDHVDQLMKKYGPLIEAVKTGRATHKQLKSLQDDVAALATATYAADVYRICTTQTLKRCSAALDVLYIGANLYFEEDGFFVRSLCSMASITRAGYNNQLLNDLTLKWYDLSLSEQESDAGQALRRQLEAVQVAVDKVGDAYIKNPAGQLIQPGCKYALRY